MITMGIDIGSTTSKCVLLLDGKSILAHTLIRAGIGTNGPQEAFLQALEDGKIKENQISRTVATGYGRKLWQQADAELSELSAHAIGCRMLMPEARTVIDIGGQDAKVISLDEHGRMSGFVMNDKCAAGTGRFLDVMATILRVEVSALGSMAEQSESPAAISSTCTVFAESEVISQLANGAAPIDVAAGVCQSVAARVGALARRTGIRREVCMTGGVAKNSGVRRALEEALKVPIQTHPHAQLAGALGAAIYAWQQANR